MRTKELNQYEQQVADFLTATHCEIKRVSKQLGYYFDGDKEQRNIYTINLNKLNKDNKPDRTYAFEFGSSIHDTKKNKAPSDYDILACLPSMSYRMSFGEFCDDFGYSIDSIQAKATWEKCFAERVELERIFSESELELLSEIN